MAKGKISGGGVLAGFSKAFQTRIETSKKGQNSDQTHATKNSDQTHATRKDKIQTKHMAQKITFLAKLEVRIENVKMYVPMFSVCIRQLWPGQYNFLPLGQTVRK